jgi:hypothetical protein
VPKHERDSVHAKTVCGERGRRLDLIHHGPGGILYVKLLGYRPEVAAEDRLPILVIKLTCDSSSLMISAAHSA